jgi:hypothetical protein
MSEHSDTFVISWDQLGLEAVVNVTEIEKEEMWEALTSDSRSNTKGRSSKIEQILTGMVLRARFNQQRHYEIYAIDVDRGVTEQDLRDLFEEGPQAAADLIRDRGRKLYSDRAVAKNIKIL